MGVGVYGAVKRRGYLNIDRDAPTLEWIIVLSNHAYPATKYKEKERKKDKKERKKDKKERKKKRKKERKGKKEK